MMANQKEGAKQSRDLNDQKITRATRFSSISRTFNLARYN